MEGDALYLSFEVLNGDTSNLAAVDIFALGLTIIEICTAEPLPGSDEPYQELRRGVLPRKMLGFSLPFQALIASMIHADHLARPTAKQLMQHPLIQSLQITATSVLVASPSDAIKPDTTSNGSSSRYSEALASFLAESDKQKAGLTSPDLDASFDLIPASAARLPEGVAMLSELALRQLLQEARAAQHHLLSAAKKYPGNTNVDLDTSIPLGGGDGRGSPLFPGAFLASPSAPSPLLRHATPSAKSSKNRLGERVATTSDTIAETILAATASSADPADPDQDSAFILSKKALKTLLAEVSLHT
jgi:serine/threonine protein kinase